MNRIWAGVVFSAAIIVALLALRGWDPPMVVALRGSGFDTLQRLWPRENTPPQPVRVVDIDEASLRKLGQWPWPRSQLANLVDALDRLGAAAVAFDVVFPEPDRMSPRNLANQPGISAALGPAAGALNTLPDNDQIFAAALNGRPTVMAFASSSANAASPPVVKAGFAQTGKDATGAPPQLGQPTTNLPELDGAAAGVGNINIDLAGEQGVARQIPMLWTDGQRLYPSLAAEALRVAQGADTFVVRASDDTENAIEGLRIGEVEVPLSERGLFFIYYRPDAPDLYVSAADVLDPAAQDRLRPLIEGNVVFIGTSAVGLLDMRTTSLGQAVPGVSIHAQAAEQMLGGTFLTRPEWAAGAEIIGFALLGLAIVAITAFYAPWTAIAAATGAAGLVLAATAYAFRAMGILVDATFPLFALATTTLASVVFRLLVTDHDKREMRRMFGHYVAPTVLAEIERNPQALNLGGEVRDVTVLFMDIANFTPLGERLSPEQLVQTVNGLWDVCDQAILAAQGTIDKFIGDAVMAFWNAPVATPNHQAQALRAALGIRNAVQRYNDDPALATLLKDKGVWPLSVRIGIASGPACVGNMGSRDRFDYSALGETVNTAARAESTCKRVGHDILLAGRVDAASARFALLQAGSAPMKGKTNVEPIHIVVGDEAMMDTPAFRALQAENDGMLRLLGNGRKKPAASERLLLMELAARHTALASYFTALSDRLEDLKPAPAHIA